MSCTRRRQGAGVWTWAAASAVILGLGPQLLAADEPECPLSRLGVRTAPLVLLTRADVRADVGLTPEQTEAAARTMKHLQTRAAELKGKSGREIVAARRA